MKTKSFFMILFFCLIDNAQAQIDPLKFIIFRMDYQSLETKYLYYFTQPYDIILPDSSETVHHDLYVKIIPAGDFGRTIIRSRPSGKTVYEATTVWSGTGEHVFPSSTVGFSQLPALGETVLKFVDFEDYFFHAGDEARADTVWRRAQELAPLVLFGECEYGVLTYLHYFSVGVADPTTAEWIVIFYSIAPKIPAGKWKNVGLALPDQHINDAIVHFGFENILFAATKQGLFHSTDEGGNWNLVEFSNDAKVNVTVLASTPNPWVDCLCEYLYLGTEEYTMIPEERQGRVFRSQLDGDNWEDMKFPGDAITAIGINPLNPHTVYAASLNPFYHRWGLYKLMGKTEWKLLMPQPYDSRLFRFNCLAVSPVDSNLVLAGTDQGLMVSRDGGANWEHRSGLSVSSLQFFENQIFLSTNNNPPSRSDGIYVSIDKASNWEVWSWWTYCVEMATTRRQEKNKPAYFFLADSSRGVFVTREAPHNWQDISDGLGKAQATCLARNLSNPPSLVVGTTKGLFKYVDISTSVFPAFENRSQAPTMLRLIFNYPNPFNAETKISFIVDRNLSHVKLNIYNSLGQQIKILFAGSKAQGEYSIKWDGKNDDGYSMPSGVYFCRIELEGQKISWTKMVLLR